MAAGAALGDRAVVLEQGSRPGGLARTHRLGEYWFDHVLHLLHFADPEIEALVRSWVGGVLAPCPPVAGIDCAAGTVRYPFQLHLGDLCPEVAASCLRDFIIAQHSPSKMVDDFEEMLLAAFGAAMCEQFFFPYNRKLWKRPLRELAPTGFQWNIAVPTVDQVTQGAAAPDGRVPAYNSNAWYPRPPSGASTRGMEVLSRALSEEVDDLRLEMTVESLDLEQRSVTFTDRLGRRHVIRYREACLSTMPLPAAVGRCRQAPPDVRAACGALPYNRVRTVAIALSGPRPDWQNLWHYYTDPSVVFTRLVNLTAFDPDLAPPGGWGLLAEVPERGDRAPTPSADLLRRTRDGLHQVGAVPPGCTILETHVMDVNPAYVVFTPESLTRMEQVRGFLTERGLTPLGRYGRWEYSSMAQVIGDGWRWGRDLGNSAVAG